MTPVGYFQRWYDVDVVLSETIKTLETLSSGSQTLFACLLERFTDGVIKARGHDFYIQLDSKKLLGLVKSKRERRWYDKDALLHKGFNKLYSLSDADKILIARELHGPVHLVRRYEEFCLEKCMPPELDRVYGIVETCFSEGLEHAESRYIREGETNGEA